MTDVALDLPQAPNVPLPPTTTPEFGDTHLADTPADTFEDYQAATVRSIVIAVSADEYAEITDIMHDLRDLLGFANNSELLVHLIREAAA